MNGFPSTLLRFTSPLRRLIRWFGGLETAVLGSLILLVVTVWAFGSLAGEVIEGDTQAIDEWVVSSFRQADDLSKPLGPEWLEEMGRDATALGGIAWLLLATAAVAGFLVLDRKPHMAAFLVASSTSGVVMSMVLKGIFSRPRPDIVPHLSHVYTSSFPSGHSMLAAVVYLTLGALVSSVVKRPLVKVYVIAIAVLLSFIVGISRVYLGVHYPSDVAAGWMAGLIWALSCSFVARRLQRSGTVEPSGMSSDPLLSDDESTPIDSMPPKSRPLEATANESKPIDQRSTTDRDDPTGQRV